MIGWIRSVPIGPAKYVQADRWAKRIIFLSLALTGCLLGLGEAVSGADQGANHTMRAFDYNGISIKYMDQGSGRPFIFLHGFGASSYTWRYLTKRFSKDYRAIAIDLKGFGLSDKPYDNRYSAQDQAIIIKSFIEKNGLRHVILAGNSFGGGVAVMTILEYSGPQSPISKMILIDSTGPKPKIPDFIAVLRMPFLNWFFAYAVPPRIASRRIAEKAFFDQSKISDEMVRVYASYVELPGARYALVRTAQQIVPPDLEALTERYEQINIPILVLWGEEDRIIPLSVGRMLASKARNAKLVVLPNCGHIPQEECPEQTAKAISDFLSDTQGM